MFPNLSPDMQLELILRSLEERRAAQRAPRRPAPIATGRRRIGRLGAARLTVGRKLVGLGEAISGQPACW